MPAKFVLDDEGRLFHVPYGKRATESFAVTWETSTGWHVAVFPGLYRRPGP